MPLKLIPPRKGKTPNYSIRGTYLRVYVDKSCGTDREAIARKQLRDLAGKIERGEYPEKPAVPAGETFLSAAVAYMQAGGERENMATLIKHFGETPIAEIDQAAVDRAAIALKPHDTPATRNRKIYTPVSAVLHSAGIEIRLKRFSRLSNGFSKKLEPHCAAVALYVAHYNLCRVHEALRATPGMGLGIADRVWSIGDLLDAALATQPIDPVVTAPDRRKRFTVIDGGKL